MAMLKRDDKIELEEMRYVTRGLLKNSYYIIIVIAIVFLIPLVLSYLQGFLRDLGISKDFDLYILILLYIVAGVISVECIRKMISNSLREVLDDYSIRGITSFFRIVGYAILLIIITSAQQGSVVFGATLGGFLGLLLGMASKELIGNAISGIFVIITKPFRIGDEVNVAGGEGKVVDIKMMYTVIEKEEQKILVPNSKIIGNVIKVKRK